MGIVKIGHLRSSDGKRHLKRSSFNSCHINELNYKESACGPDSADDLYLDEIVESGCEYCILEDQICSIPYDLYCVPDLKEVLSVETWNSCLTEEEKFSLSAYLPDMDQETFWLTMKELLSGQEIFFGSPLKEFFDRLKGGFYTFRVPQFRKGLNFLQRRLFYHTLKSYHENMRKTFSDMKRVWSNCQFDATIEDRIRVWKLWKNCNSLDGIDLNSFPFEAQTEDRFPQNAFLLENNDLLTSRLLGKEMIASLSSRNTSETVKINAKGILKRTTVMDSIPTGVTCRPPPKGVLKIIPTYPLPPIAQKTSPAISGRQMHIGYPMPQLNRGLDPDHSSYCPSDAFINRTLRCRSTYGGLEIGSSSEDNLGLSITSSGQNLLRHTRMIDHTGGSGSREMARESDLFQTAYLGISGYNEEDVELGGKCLSERNSWEDCGLQNMDHYYYRKKKAMQMPVYMQISDALLSCNVNGSHHQKFSASCDQLKARDRGASELELDKSTCEGLGISLSPRDTGAFQITYKRRKTCKKVDPLNDPVKVATTRVTSECTTTLAQTNQHGSKTV